MTPLIIKIIVAAVALSGLGLFSYLAGSRNQQLKQFRANLTPGTTVRIRFSDGRTIRARIMKRNNIYSFFTMDIDTREPHIAHIDDIFKP